MTIKLAYRARCETYDPSDELLIAEVTNGAVKLEKEGFAVYTAGKASYTKITAEEIVRDSAKLLAFYNYNNCTSLEMNDRIISATFETKSGRRMVLFLLFPHDHQQHFFELFTERIPTKDVWLDDQVINGFMALLEAECKRFGSKSVIAYSTFHYSKLSADGASSMLDWFASKPLSYHQLAFFPLHTDNNHWSLIALDLDRKVISYYDSYPFSRDNHAKTQQIREHFMDLLSVLNPGEMEYWDFVVEKNCGEQSDGSSCGVFTLQWASLLVQGISPLVQQEDVPSLRRLIAKSIAMNHVFIN